MTAVGDARSELLALLRRDAWKRGRFRLASGRESDFFIDCKQVVLTATGHRLVGEVLCDAIRDVLGDGHVGAVAGVALGGCPLASAVSLTSSLRGFADGRGWDALYVRKEAKDHGTGKRIEGRRTEGGAAPKVVLVEDVATTGGSSLTAIEALRSEGFEVGDVFVLVDREEGAAAAMAAAGVRAHAVFTRAQVTEAG